MEQVKDFRGIPIEVGDTIVYPGRSGSCLWMQEGKVVEITEKTNWNKTYPVLKVRGIKKEGRLWSHDKLVTIECIKRVAVVVVDLLSGIKQKDTEEEYEQWLHQRRQI